MKSSYLINLLLSVAVLIGCSKKEEATSASEEWYRNDEGLITSGIQPVDRGMKVIQDENQFSMSWKAPEKALRDPLEDMPVFSKAFEEANLVAKKKTDEYEQQIGLIHVYWSEKKRVLRERFHIDWKTPAELNTHINYD